MSKVVGRNAAHRSHARNVSINSIQSSPKLAQSTRIDGRNSYESKDRTSLDTKASFESVQQHSLSLQRFVVADPIALRFLEDDPSVTVLERRTHVTGYECYIVEQWATARAHPTFAISSYTGDQNDAIIAAVVAIPADETAWSPGLRAYFKALNRYHARRRDTTFGFIMTISIAAFPSSLTVIRVPNGDLAACRMELLVNEDLKRLGCSGRTGLTFVKPNSATVAKYHQLYHTSGKAPLADSVLELVKMCQSALHLFDALAIECVDGLLCDLTERAINEWWSAIGSELYSDDPHDGILGPTTVAALLGALFGARNRLHALGAAVPKDPLDMDEMKRGISRFQKGQRILRTRRLDRQTMLRLHKASNKAAHAEGWSMPKAVKSTVAELSGKGGEMLAEAVGRRDRTGIADIETINIETFQDLVYGERGKWLWHGKALKHIVVGEATIEGRLILKDDDKSFTWTALKAIPAQSSAVQGSKAFLLHQKLMMDGGERPEQEDNGTKPLRVRQKATELLHEGRQNLDKLRNVVHLRGHQTAQSIDETPRTPPRLVTAIAGSPAIRTTLQRASSLPLADSSPTKASHWFNQALRRGDTLPTGARNGYVSANQALQQRLPPSPSRSRSRTEDSIIDDKMKRSMRPVSMSRDELSYLGDALPEPAVEGKDVAGTLLRRTMSMSAIDECLGPYGRPGLPRYLSYSIVNGADAVVALSEGFSAHGSLDLDKQMLIEKLYLSQLQSLRSSIARIANTDQIWIKQQLSSLDTLTTQTTAHLSYVSCSQLEPTKELSELKDRIAAAIRDQKEVLGETTQEIDTLASKLDYEIASLRDKVEDIELGIADFEQGVVSAESAAGELEKSGHGGWGCVVM